MNEMNSEPKRFNKKKIIPLVILGLLVIGIASAIIVPYFGQRTTTIDVELPIEIEGETFNELEGLGCTQAEGNELTIVNKAGVEIDVNLTSTEEEGVETSYTAILELTKKNSTTWSILEDKQYITYTVVGNTFEVSGVPEGHTLIYYKDQGTYTTDIERLLVLGKSATLSVNMPHENDWNNGNNANYCDNGIDNYVNCKGAKLWIVPDENIAEGLLIWTNPENFYFETNLIQYNKEGVITMYPNSQLTIKPVFNLDCMLNGTVEITTTIGIVE